MSLLEPHIDVEKEKAAVTALVHEYPPDKMPKQIGVFLLVGILGTIAEFAVMNFFLYAAHLPLAVANSFGITAGLIVGYFTDKKWVFKNSKPPTKKNFGYFLVISAIGLYGVQNGLMYMFAVFPHVLAGTVGFFQSVVGHVSLGVMRTNISKLVATTVAGIFDYFLYRRYVFTYSKKRAS